MSETPHCNASPLAHQPPPTPPCALAELVPRSPPPHTHPTPHPGTVGAVAVVAALVGVGVYVKIKATKPPASAGGQAQGGVTLSAPAQRTGENKV